MPTKTCNFPAFKHLGCNNLSGDSLQKTGIVCRHKNAATLFLDFSAHKSTVARWPNFRPNYSSHEAKNWLWPVEWDFFSYFFGL
jgi:hypothetical protein